MDVRRSGLSFLWCVVVGFGMVFAQIPVSGQERFDPSTASFLIEPGRAGPFIAGITPDELYRNIDRARVELIDVYAEGSFLPALRVTLPGSEDPSLVAYLDMLDCDRFRAWWLPTWEVRDPRFRTADGMGVGSTYQELKERGWVTADGLPGERALHERARNFPTISFHFWEWECEGCGLPEDDDEVLVVTLKQPLTELRPRRCDELWR